MKQTAVQFAVEKLEKFIPSGNQIAIGLILEQAKEMFKKQMIDFATKYDEYCHNSFIQNRHQSVKSAEEFYNETFESALPISDNEYKKIIKALYPKDNSRAFKKE